MIIDRRPSGSPARWGGIMAAPSGPFHQWQSLPFPVRLAGYFLGGVTMIWLTRWLGGISVLVALLLWCAAGIGLLHAGGRLTWLDRYPWATRILGGFAPRLTVGGATAAAAATASAPAPPPSGPAPPRQPSAAAPAAVDLSRFAGLDGVLADIDELVGTRTGRISLLAPATLVLLVGPRGTGKSSVARALVAKLHRAGALSSDRIITIAPAELPGFGGAGGYGPSED